MTSTRIAETAKPIPLDIVGSATFGNFPIISLSNTYNMFIVVNKDDEGQEKKSLIPFAGYKFVLNLGGNGRSIFPSVKSNFIFATSQNSLYQITESLQPQLQGTLSTTSGDVYTDEDIANNIALCDGVNIYINNYVTGRFYIVGTAPFALPTGTVSQSGNTITGVSTNFASNMVGATLLFDDNTTTVITAFSSATSITVNTSASKVSQGYLIYKPQLDFVPNYVCFHDSRFIATSAESNGSALGQWRLSKILTTSSGNNSIVVFPSGISLPQFQGLFQTKPDLPVAVVRMPGRANTILIMGSISSEFWTDYGLAIFPYQKNTSLNLDYGCVNPSTIATIGNLVVWIGANEKAAPVIMYTTGQDIVPISTDGIDKVLENIKFPSQSYGFAYKQNGHIFYIFTFYEPSDNLTLMYDFKTGKFYTLTDEEMNYHIAKHIIFFNNAYYFNSINDGNIYQLSANFTNYTYQNSVAEIPRIRTCSTFRTEDSLPKVLNTIVITTEQGVDAKNLQTGSNIASISITNGGANYTTASVIIDGDGTGAHATVTLTNGVVTGIVIVSAGIGYSWAVATVTGDGIGAQLSTILNQDAYNPRISLTISYDGGYTFSSNVDLNMYAQGHYNSRLVYNELGYSNQFTPTFRFIGLSRFVVTDAEMNFYE